MTEFGTQEERAQGRGVGFCCLVVALFTSGIRREAPEEMSHMLSDTWSYEVCRARDPTLMTHGPGLLEWRAFPQRQHSFP